MLLLLCAVRIQFIHRCTLAGLSQNGRTDGGQQDSNKKCEKVDIKNKEHKVTVISDEVWICVQKVITPINNCCYPGTPKLRGPVEVTFFFNSQNLESAIYETYEFRGSYVLVLLY